MTDYLSALIDDPTTATDQARADVAAAAVNDAVADEPETCRSAVSKVADALRGKAAPEAKRERVLSRLADAGPSCS